MVGRSNFLVSIGRPKDIRVPVFNQGRPDSRLFESVTHSHLSFSKEGNRKKDEIAAVAGLSNRDSVVS